MIEITEAANEKSTKSFTVVCTDEDGTAVTPTALLWTLVDVNQTLINSREQEVHASLSTSMTITLTGDDLQILSTETTRKKVKRYLVLEATYDSSLGNDMANKEEVEFFINNLNYVS